MKSKSLWGIVILIFLSVSLPVSSDGGDIKVTIKEWEVPTPNSRPHDPAVDPEGSLWYTGQLVNVLGRLDPRTGKIREYPLMVPDSGPHGLVSDKEGNIWFTANYKGYIGKLNPSSGVVTE
ncbi:MAG: hypothetical protein HY787_13000 [Deltaproteobacteria bacterium]|nr:hypothetical protein [Deltaproteobacteria bacterium]